MAQSLEHLLKKRFRSPEWGILFEVRNATGFARVARSADALAMSLWPSRGLLLHGIEVKAARSDWLRELHDPEKSAPIQAYCDYWWLAADKGVAEAEEIPATWGFLERRGAKLVAIKQAPKLDPRALDRAFLAAIFRRLAENQDQFVLKSEIEEALEERYNEGVESGLQRGQYELKHVKEALTKRDESIEKFEREAGIRIPSWTYDVGHTVEIAKLVKDHSPMFLEGRLKHALELFENTAANLRHALEEYRRAFVEADDPKDAVAELDGRVTPSAS